MTQTDRIEIRGLQLLAYCGVLPHEQEHTQPLEVDIDMYVDLKPAGNSDALDDTVNYGEVIAAVLQLAANHRFALLEKMAAEIMGLLGEQSLLEAATVSIRKMRPPVEAHVATTGVRIHRCFKVSS